MEIGSANDIQIMNSISRKSVKDGIKGGDIPEWLLTELLLRLPLKNVFRSKLVCKQWLSIILDPIFVKLYCSRVMSLQPWTFVSDKRHFNPHERKYMPDCELLVDIHSNNLKWPYVYALSLPCFPHPQEKGYEIHGISQGLVLYGPNKVKEAVFHKFMVCRICNPVTGQWIALPSLRRLRFVSWGFTTHVEYGVLISYTVVRLDVNPMNKSKFITYDVFSSEVGEWKNYIAPLGVEIEVSKHILSVVLNGVIHWMLTEHGLIAYDPQKHPDKVRLISLPDEQKGNLLSHFCGAYEGQLRYFKISTSPISFNIWVLRDYTSGNWCLQHHAKLADSPVPTAFSSLTVPISFHPYDSHIVYFVSSQRRIIIYNTKTRRLEIPKDFKKLQFLDSRSPRLLTIQPWPLSLSCP